MLLLVGLLSVAGCGGGVPGLNCANGEERNWTMGQVHFVGPESMIVRSRMAHLGLADAAALRSARTGRTFRQWPKVHS